MECPRCGHDQHRIIRTQRGSQTDRREIICKQCGQRGAYTAGWQDVFDYDPETMKEREYKLDVWLAMQSRARASSKKLKRLDA